MSNNKRTKSDWLTMLRDEYAQWVALLDAVTPDHLNHRPADDYSLTQALGHLWAWEQLTVARLEAALENRDLRFDLWPEPYEADTDEGTDVINAKIQKIVANMTWDQLVADWKSTFQRLIELTERVPEADLMAEGRYSWMNGSPLYYAIGGSIGHHHEHLEALQAHLGISPEAK